MLRIKSTKNLKVIIIKNLDHGVRGILQKAALGRGEGWIIFKNVNFIKSKSIQNIFLFSEGNSLPLRAIFQ